MATLIRESHSDGTERRCDARCHNAKRPECECICGGRYHGCGRGGVQPQSIVDAELLLLGEDPNEVDPELKREVSERVLCEMTGYFERFKRAHDARLSYRWTGSERRPQPPAAGARPENTNGARTAKQLQLPL